MLEMHACLDIYIYEIPLFVLYSTVKCNVRFEDYKMTGTVCRQNVRFSVPENLAPGIMSRNGKENSHTLSGT
jgi:hypothetical protein